MFHCEMSPRHTALLATLALTALGSGVPSAAAAPSGSVQNEELVLRGKLAREMRPAGSSSGAYVANVDRGRAVFQWRHKRARILASNTKLFTTSAALARFGPAARLNTGVRGDGELDLDGTYRGNLYLVGGGDPTFGSRRFGLRAYGGGASAVEDLAVKLKELGILRVTGRVVGDESRFDTLRGGPDSGYRTSIYVGPLSGLAYNRGLASESGRGFQLSPPTFAAARLDSALAHRGVSVEGAARAGRAPRDSRLLTFVSSPTIARLAALTNKPSDNFFAETLLKDLEMQATGKGTTAGGARIAAAFASRLGSAARLMDGSGLSRGNRASPLAVAKLLIALRDREDEFPAFFGSLSIAGRDGTLRPRMRRGPARSRCRGKTGTLSGVSAVSGYCKARSGETYVFSILMNGVNPFGARRLQDRMLQAIAGVRGD
ncbi:MAG: D-alanyl-D-alanine carboxypeptidase/D-alanyl-D-alanine-endopeptidase [Thermoleophilaceae bacterium]|nr:D-alanyl-D-alanine carboxypeptidase/D-alanyl-D-alanine-endopeptidase [Thermoleophilaceae bacterium]